MINVYLDILRSKGWRVAIHNDYIEHGGLATFWLFTHPESGRFIKGEGATDEIALQLCIGQINNILR